MDGLLTKCEVKEEVKMAGYWPSSFFACLWTETKTQLDYEKIRLRARVFNEAQPTWLSLVENEGD